MAMAAVGTRGELVAGGASGFGLAFKADGLWVGAAIDSVDGPAGRLKATGAAVTLNFAWHTDCDERKNGMGVAVNKWEV